jgi:ATP-dependent DNA helicase RecG
VGVHKGQRRGEFQDCLFMTDFSIKKHPTLELLKEWLEATEGEHFEFKEARDSYSFEKLAKYCCALANEGGGKIIFGVTDRRPRIVVGSHAFEQPEQTRRALSETLFLRIDFLEITHPNGRVIVFEIPPYCIIAQPASA